MQSTDDRAVTRRSFVRSAGAWLTVSVAWVLTAPSASEAAALRPLAGAAPAAGLSNAELRRRISCLFRSPRSAARVGARYLRQYPARARRDVLLADAGIVWADRPDPRTLAAAFADARHRDFLAGRIVVLDGWVLAQCEVACCGLLAAPARGC